MNIIKRDVFVLADRLKQPIDYVQGANAVPIEFSFRDYEIPDDVEVRVLVAKPSGHIRYENVVTRIGNVVTIKPDQQMMAEAGISALQLEVVKDKDILATFVQPINVKKSGIPVDSQSGSGFLEELIEDVKEATGKANEATGKANEATEKANKTADNIEEKAQNGDFSATVEIGETTTGQPGTVALVTNAGTTKDTVLNFRIPQGIQGIQGDSGVTAPSSGFFTLWVEAGTGDLYCDYMDGVTPPQFTLEPNGDLYIEIGGTT